MNELLINIDDESNTKIMLVENGALVEYYEEKNNNKRIEGNIYLGKVVSIMNGMQAAFIDIGEEKNSFIHIKDIMPNIDKVKNKDINYDNINIKDILEVGQSILIQVKREPVQEKGGRVSTHISLPGRYVVLMPEADFITISQKIESVEEKERLLNIAQKYMPKGFGCIIRTVSENKTEDNMKKDIDNLYEKWINLKKTVNLQSDSPCLIYEESNIIKEAIRDILREDVVRIVVNKQKTYAYISRLIKEYEILGKELVLENVDILSRYRLENQIENIYSKRLWLKCGGFIVIEKTEALTTVDVNSGKYTGVKNLENTAFIVNKEAAYEITKQLRLRDIGGIIIVDFIDMYEEQHREEIINIFRSNMRKDRSKVEVKGFTQLYLLELTRKHVMAK